MSKSVFIYALLYALPCLAAVNPNGMSIPAPAAPPATAVATATATATGLTPAPAPVTAEVGFSDGSFALTPAGVQGIQIALREAKQRGQLSEVRVLAWGDVSTVAGQAAPGAQVALAEQRSQAVAGFVRASNPAAPVKTVNVTQNPTALQTLLADPTLGARAALGNVGLVNPDASAKRSEAIVLLIVR